MIAAWKGLEDMETESMFINTKAGAENKAKNRFTGDLHDCMRILHLITVLIASTRVAGLKRLSIRY